MQDLFSLKGRVALVTGGSRGIGKMIAEGFLHQGAKVYISARKGGALEETATELSAIGPCIPLIVDASGLDGAQKMADAFLAYEDTLDILVNNAGAAWGAAFDEFPENGWDKVMDLNVKTPFFLTQKLHDALKRGAAKGHLAKVINIVSIDGVSVNQQETYSYAASKAGLIHLTKRMALRLIQDNIAVSAIAPIWSRRPFQRSASARPKTWRAPRSISPRAPAITSWGLPSSSTAGSPTRAVADERYLHFRTHPLACANRHSERPHGDLSARRTPN
jgi:NAD(P)-dependent dehydrogenase (short-subunit alcohol dehydrogenase family)